METIYKLIIGKLISDQLHGERLMKGQYLKGIMYTCVLLLVGCDSQLNKNRQYVREAVRGLGINPIEVRVSHVVDGDTFVYEVDNHPSGTVNLGCTVTAFRLNQENGVQSKVELQSLLPQGSKVEIFPLSFNQDGSMEAVVINHKNWVVNDEVVRSGWAVLNPHETPEPKCIKVVNDDNFLRMLNSSFSEGLNSGPFYKKDTSRVELPWDSK